MEKVEDDAVCALLSEATEMFVKRVLKVSSMTRETVLTKLVELTLRSAVKSSVAGSQKDHDIDGIRIFTMNKIAKSPPPLGLVISCDITKQLAARQFKNARVYKMQPAAAAPLGRNGQQRSKAR